MSPTFQLLYTVDVNLTRLKSPPFYNFIMSSSNDMPQCWPSIAETLFDKVTVLDQLDNTCYKRAVFVDPSNAFYGPLPTSLRSFAQSFLDLHRTPPPLLPSFALALFARLQIGR